MKKPLIDLLREKAGDDYTVEQEVETKQDSEDNIADINLTVKELIALILSDIDVSLLQTNDFDKGKLFTKKEIRNQLFTTGKNICFLLKNKTNIDIKSKLQKKYKYRVKELQRQKDESLKKVIEELNKIYN